MGHLIQCNINQNHWYSDHATICPWCALARQLGTDPFPINKPELSRVEEIKDSNSRDFNSAESITKNDNSNPIDYRKFNSKVLISSIITLCVVIIAVVILTSSSLLSDQPAPSVVTPEQKTVQKVDSFPVNVNTNKKTDRAVIQPETKKISQPEPTIRTLQLPPEKSNPLGVVTIEFQGSNPFSWGQEIHLSGKNTASNEVYLFYVQSKGKDTSTIYNLDNPPREISPDQPSLYTKIPVNEKDKTWEYTWNTSSDELQLINCYVYAASSPQDVSSIHSSVFDKTGTLIIGAKPVPTLIMTADSGSSDGDSF